MFQAHASEVLSDGGVLIDKSQQEVCCVSGHDEDKAKMGTPLERMFLIQYPHVNVSCRHNWPCNRCSYLVAGKDGLQSHNVLCDRT